jgi:hypothetical protein
MFGFASRIGGVDEVVYLGGGLEVDGDEEEDMTGGRDAKSIRT